ncbi:MAG: undecaprenyldiphospho-muramoylpentapeptide beta-N-acetylglucosaminyltransferase [Alphaproteobacteria bacterium]|nr:undecaprenyldiphospho-muramoylpentapeptide beta-N-acetylglucosaminyltransferase [Alphaproteobacteria bacterium]
MTDIVPPTVVLAAGGTGGHLFPAQATAQALIARGAHVILATDSRGMTYPMPDGVDRMQVPSAAPVGNMIAKLMAVAKLAAGAASIGRKLGRLRPDLVIGFGGYPSVPTVLAAQQRGIPTILHEQNALMGRANRFLAGRATVIATGMPTLENAPEGKPVVFVGNPVRQAVLESHTPYLAPSRTEPFNLLVFGGSQGARVFSTLIPEAIALLDDDVRARLHITQQVRQEDLDQVRGRYRDMGIEAETAAFFDDMPDRYAKAHLVISRAGASTCAELTATGRPAILVPFPFAAGDHQTFNAKVLDKAEAALLRPQASLTENLLARELLTLISHPGRLTAMAGNALTLAEPTAHETLADLVMESVSGRAAA